MSGDQGCPGIRRAVKGGIKIALMPHSLPYRYCLYPHPHRKAAPARAFGCARVVRNNALALSNRRHQEGGEYPGGAALQRLCIIQAKCTPERAWLAEVANVPLQQSIRDPDQAFRNWWKSKGCSRAPRFKRRNNRQGIRFQSNTFRVEGEKLRLVKVGSIPVQWSRDLPAPPTSVTVIEDCTGRYFASFLVGVEHLKLPANDKAVGMDLGLVSLAVTSDGEKITPPKFLRSAPRKLRRLQQALSRTHKTSRTRGKARFSVARCHAKVADNRLHFLHKLSTRFIRENQVVGIADLNVSSGLPRNRKPARSIPDVGGRMFRVLLESKAQMYGRAVQIFNRWHPSSQTCSECEHRNGKKPLRVRRWQCPECGAVHDRDVNAAGNLVPEVAAGSAATQNACLSRSKSSLLVSGVDAGTHLNREVQRCTA